MRLSAFILLVSTLPAAEFAGDLARTASTSIPLRAGETAEVSAGLPSPSQLPPNGRVAVEFAGFRKILHALDPDFYMVFRAPAAGKYALTATVVEDEEAIFNLPRWREPGTIQKVSVFPAKTAWPAGQKVRLRLSAKTVNFGVSKRHLTVEAEPNDSIAQAQPIQLGGSGGDETHHVIGGADDLEYFDNGKVGQGPGEDWFRIEFQGKAPKLFTANLVATDPLVVLQVRCYTADGKEYREGANANERVHQQLEGYRSALTRTFQPGGVYFLRVEANSPGYDLELRVRDLAPYTDPRRAVRQAMYDHLGQVNAWLLNRPRGAAVDRRIRDTGSLLGTHCMSCHTQSGVWGPAGAMRNGYRLENVQNFRHLSNIMYESLRPTNELAEAANNTSLAPLDLGDGPAGTRVAGFNVVNYERVSAPRRLHAAQQQRTANFVLQSADPSGINAAGPGSNIGQSVVYRFAGEILMRAWRDTRNDKYLAGFEEKVRKVLDVKPRFSDDYSNRIIFLKELFPADYLAIRGETDETKALVARIAARIAEDERELRKLQKADGAWGFSPQVSTDPKDTDPAPTALALNALAVLGFTDSDAAVARGVKALLAMQDSYGRWNRAALTGFVTTAYSIHALSKLYPARDAAPEIAMPGPGDSLADTIAAYRALAYHPNGAVAALAGAAHPSPQVRYWAMIALGAAHDERAVDALITGLSDPVKMVREAARWGLRQTLLDDKGWDKLFPASAAADDLGREQIAAALIMRADAVMPRSGVGWARLGAALERMMNSDPSPAVRAWAGRAAWNWWVWNPPVRQAINASVLRALERDEPNALAENSLRYQLEALFIANGQRANPSAEHQYPELKELFAAIGKRVDSLRVQDRLTAIAATYYSQAGGDGGPGQMGYITPGASEMMGRAVLASWKRAEASGDKLGLRLAVESAANIVYDPLQKKLVDYASSGPEELRTIASTSISDPRLITLNAAQEFVEPLMQQFYRGAQEPERRSELAQPLVRLFSRSRWNLPESEEQKRIFYKLIIPVFSEERGRLEENTRRLLQMDKESYDWYVARSLAGILHANPDLQTPFAATMVPERFLTPMEELYWLPSLRWLLEVGTSVPEVGQALPLPDGPAQRRVAALFVKALEVKGDSRLRGQALSMAGDVNIRKHPVTGPALAKAVPEYFEAEPPEVANMTPEWRRNWEYFRDYWAPEMTRVNRDDQQACLSCHGLPGRVPSLELTAADNRGYIKAADLYSNFRKLVERVNETNVEQSKLLRKPLNVQSGQEDGHQGGRRYNPNDRGYQILRRWVLDVAALKKAAPPTR
jgi:hypothetical protein